MKETLGRSVLLWALWLFCLFGDLGLKEFLGHLEFNLRLLMATLLTIAITRDTNAKELLRTAPTFNSWSYLGRVALPAKLSALGTSLLSIGILIEYFPAATKWLEAVLDKNLSPTPTEFTDLIFAIILAPIFEELLFRAVLLRRIAKEHSSTTALLLSSLAFTLFHFNPLGSFLSSMVYGLSLVATGSLWAPIALHCFNNTFLALLEGSGTVESSEQLILVGVLLFMIGLPALIRLFKDFWPRENQLKPNL